MALAGAQGLFFVSDRFAEVIHDPAAHVHRPELVADAEVLDVATLPLHLLMPLSFLKACRLVQDLEYCNRLKVLHLAPLPTDGGLGASLRGFPGMTQIRLETNNIQAENIETVLDVTKQFCHLKQLQDVTITGLTVKEPALLL